MVAALPVIVCAAILASYLFKRWKRQSLPRPLLLLIMRAPMVDALHEQYLTTAKAKSLPSASVRDRRA